LTLICLASLPIGSLLSSFGAGAGQPIAPGDR
jgi:hypothetical protein